jgi:1,5-anhydro-D-fructose reductase (1,5-anhydro-D-mannitol-forming)
MTDLGWGFAGASTWARRYLVPAVRATEGAWPVAVFSSSGERGAQFAQDCGLERAYASMEALLGDPDVDVVYVSTTNDLHASLTIAAAEAGKHVLCEKPLAMSVEDAVRMREACRQAGVVLATNHHLRGAPAIVATRRLIEEGAIGEIRAARVFHANSLPEELRTWRLTRPEAGGGAVLDLTVHDADTIRFLLGDEIVEVVAATASDYLGKGVVEDSAMSVVRTAQGVLVSFHDSFTVPHAPTGVEIFGSTGAIIVQDALAAEPIGRVLLRRDRDMTEIELPKVRSIYEVAVARFNAAVRGEGEPLASADDGIASLAVAIAALESARTGRPVAPRSA